MRFTLHSLGVGLALTLPVSSSAQEGLLRLSCEGAQETNTVAADPQYNRKAKERKSATVTVNPATGLVDFQNLGLIAFGMAKEPVVCLVRPAEIFCDKTHTGKESMFKSTVEINRYSGLLTESQMIIMSGANAYVTSITGEYKCQTLEKPLF